MLRFLVRRVVLSVPVLALASVVVFFGVSSVGDPVGMLRIQPRVSQEAIEAMIERKHLDEPLPQRYVHWLREAATERFGVTITNRPIWPELRRALGNTLQLVVVAELLSLAVGIALGVAAATRPRSALDHGTAAVSLLGYSVPIFWFALMLQVVFTNLYLATGVRFFYTAGLSSPDAGSGLSFLWDRMQHLALPVIAIAYVNVALYSRYMRASLLDVLGADYVRTAHAKGLAPRRVLVRHAMRNALIPVVTVAAISLGATFGGAVVTESIFSIDGMGLFFLRALARRELYSVMAFLMVTAVIVVVANLVADVAYGYLDPRVRRD